MPGVAGGPQACDTTCGPDRTMSFGFIGEGGACVRLEREPGYGARRIAGGTTRGAGGPTHVSHWAPGAHRGSDPGGRSPGVRFEAAQRWDRGATEEEVFAPATTGNEWPSTSAARTD